MSDEAHGTDADAGTIRRLCGDLPDKVVTDILETEATIAEVETALAWVEGSENVRDGRHELSPAAAAVVEIIEAETSETEER